ncbi:MAG TPA: DUF2127 domain-containing protein [Terriglobia bacterium]|jgi:uncharacterized membrane protein (DUF2068 family)
MSNEALFVNGHAKDRWITLIALLKLFKGFLLFASGVGLLKLLHRDVADFVLQWINILHFDPDNRHIQTVLAKASIMDARRLKELSVGSFFYSGLLLTEGFGLLADKRWARYFSVIVTASFIPLEIWELAQRFTAAKTCVIGLNVAIVWYLIRKLRDE